MKNIFCKKKLLFKRKLITDSIYWLINPQNRNRTDDGQYIQIFGLELKPDTGNYVSTQK